MFYIKYLSIARFLVILDGVQVGHFSSVSRTGKINAKINTNGSRFDPTYRGI